MYDEILTKRQAKYYIDDNEFDFFEKELRKKNKEKRAEEYRQITMQERYN